MSAPAALSERSIAPFRCLARPVPPLKLRAGGDTVPVSATGHGGDRVNQPKFRSGLKAPRFERFRREQKEEGAEKDDEAATIVSLDDPCGLWMLPSSGRRMYAGYVFESLTDGISRGHRGRRGCYSPEHLMCVGHLAKDADDRSHVCHHRGRQANVARSCGLIYGPGAAHAHGQV